MLKKGLRVAAPRSKSLLPPLALHLLTFGRLWSVRTLRQNSLAREFCSIDGKADPCRLGELRLLHHIRQAPKFGVRPRPLVMPSCKGS
ncbi:hypothetical protein MPL1032_60034 [Mesorhizobium plurifarium]|uniref:Uncharacterized protein n=1 Tax=Mesorhizobium plurifarium TaxID=69974 RepID=A0A0K2W6L7_MESPL|nr:hypothetical protein MPL1032_60034 [Mesorhizobium plurifarium]